MYKNVGLGSFFNITFFAIHRYFWQVVITRLQISEDLLPNQFSLMLAYFDCLITRFWIGNAEYISEFDGGYIIFMVSCSSIVVHLLFLFKLLCLLTRFYFKMFSWKYEILLYLLFLHDQQTKFIPFNRILYGVSFWGIAWSKYLEK